MDDLTVLSRDDLDKVSAPDFKNRYVFDAQKPRHSSNTLVFDPTGKCPAFVVNPKIARRAREKQNAR
jgi:hypothetical protein